MNRFIVSLAIVVSTAPALASDVGASIGFDRSGLYGRIDIGRVPQPPVLVYPQPIVVVPTPVAIQRQPIYLHVPPGHAKNWNKHCGRYQACGQPVLFVQEGWYRDVYGPAHHHQRGEHWDKQQRKHEKQHLKQERKHHKKHDKKHGKQHHD